ncbi:MAG: hypothetical protein EBU49_01060, partial [Proteobacteria bacterium]|nr:hypothetical protein [Pseudomonadota bacterium]
MQFSLTAQIPDRIGKVPTKVFLIAMLGLHAASCEIPKGKVNASIVGAEIGTCATADCETSFDSDAGLASIAVDANGVMQVSESQSTADAVIMPENSTLIIKGYVIVPSATTCVSQEPITNITPPAIKDVYAMGEGRWRICVAVVRDRKRQLLRSPEIIVDSTAPSFNAGAISVTGNNTMTPTLSWAAASDNYAAAFEIRYQVRISESQISTIADALTVADHREVQPGSTAIQLSDLLAGKAYYAVVIGIDRAGNANMTSQTSFLTGPQGLVSTPAFSIAAGAYGPTQSVLITTSTAGAAIYYTVDGVTTPSSATPPSLLYTGPVSVSSTQTIKAIAIKDSYSDSTVASATYTINGAVAEPSFSVATGTYNSDQSVTITSTTSDATIYYTTDGNTPSPSSAVYSTQITVSNSGTVIKAYAVRANYEDSATRAATYTLQAANPTASIGSSTLYSAPQNVDLSTATDGAFVTYSADGSPPDCSGATGTVIISASTTIKAIACKTGYQSSSVVNFTYTVNPVTSRSVVAFPDTTNFPTVSWTPNVKFQIASNDTLGLYSDTAGTSILSPTPVTAGSNILSANTISTLGETNTVFGQFSGSSTYINMGNYTTKMPANYSVPGLNGFVSAMVHDGSGNIYAGGSFTAAGGFVANYVAKWNGSTSSWSAVGTGMNSFVNALAIDSSGNLYAGGDFTTAGGITANHIAKWDGNAWSALGTSVDSFVYALAVDSSGNLYAGGDFTTAGGIAANYIAKWNGTAWSAVGTSMDSRVYSLAVDSSGNLYAGGDFTTAGGIAANYIAKWNGTAWSALGTSLNSGASALAVDSSGNLYAGGDFTVAGGTAANYNIAKWDGTAWSGLGTGTNGYVNDLAVDSSGNLYAGGYFSTAGGITANYIAKWDGSSTSPSWSALGTGMNAYVYALAVDSSGNLYAGGDFTTAGDITANYFAKWDHTTSSWSAFATGINGSVAALAFDPSGNLYAYVYTAGGIATNYVAKWGGTLWSAIGTGFRGGGVYNMATDPSGNLYAGGNFTAIAGVAAAKVAKWNATTSSWSALGTGIDGPAVRTLAFDSSGMLYAGGSFFTAGGVDAESIAKWDGTAWSALGAGISGGVLALAFDSSGNLYAGGNFTEAGGVAANYIAKWDGTAWSALGAGMNHIVQALAVDSSGNLYAGGQFITAEGVTVNRVAK